MTETPTKKPRRSAKEIAQANADKATAALEKHDEKEGKIQAKIDKLQEELTELAGKRQSLVAEADYRQMHPLLRENTDQAPTEGADANPSSDDEYNPFG